METKEFIPDKYIPVKRSIEFIIKVIILVIIMFLLIYSGILDVIHDSNIKSGSLFYKSLFILILTFLYVSWKLFSTITAIDFIKIDTENKKIIIHYYFLFFKKKITEIEFDSITFKSRDEPLFMGHSYAIYFYKTGSFVAKLNGTNGWKCKQVKEIEEILIAICKEYGRRYKIGW